MSEYASNFVAYLQLVRSRGITIRVVPNGEHGAISMEELKVSIDDSVKLIAPTHVPTNGGLVNPVEEAGEIAGKAGILYLSQRMPLHRAMPIDVKRIECDMLSATGRKFLRGAAAGNGIPLRSARTSQMLERRDSDETPRPAAYGHF
jgi:selenocysteine lyase/cysteine desulfurase